MERMLEFKNFEQSNNHISADLYLDGKYLMRMFSDMQQICSGEKTDVVLYEYFRTASLYYINQEDDMLVNLSPASTTKTTH